jgi:ComF family protein
MPRRTPGLLRAGLCRAAWAALDLVVPPRCGGCRRLGQRYCDRCWAETERLTLPVCPRCGCPLAEARAGCWCQPAANAALNGVRCAAYNGGPLRKAIHRLKYNGDIGLAAALAPLLEGCWRLHGLRADMLVAVPLSAGRLRQRGYNQAGLLAEALGERVGVPRAPGALRRARETPSQVSLNWGERYANVAGAFRADPMLVRGRTVALIDDVCTTGATLAACAAALNAAGAQAVWGVAVARPRRDAGDISYSPGGIDGS